MTGRLMLRRPYGNGEADGERDAGCAAWSAEYGRLVREVRKALADWKRAECRFHQAESADQVDVAVYELEAAEKRVDMLLRQAKQLWREQTVRNGSGRPCR